MLLKHLGLLDNVLTLGISQEKQAFLLSLIIDSSQDNIKKDLQGINYARNPGINNKQNLQFLAEIFTKAGLPNHVKNVEKSLNSLKTEGKKKNK